MGTNDREGTNDLQDNHYQANIPTREEYNLDKGQENKIIDRKGKGKDEEHNKNERNKEFPTLKQQKIGNKEKKTTITQGLATRIKKKGRPPMQANT